MSEKGQRAAIIRALKMLDARAVENRVGAGTPDVNFVGGWLELKWMRRWPKKGGIVKIEHYTDTQRLWLARRWNAKGWTGLLLQVGRQHLLFEAPFACWSVGRCSQQDLYDGAVKVWQNGMKNAELRTLMMTLPRPGRNYSYIDVASVCHKRKSLDEEESP